MQTIGGFLIFSCVTAAICTSNWEQYVPKDILENARNTPVKFKDGSVKPAKDPLFQSDLNGCKADGPFLCGRWSPQPDQWRKGDNSARIIQYMFSKDIPSTDDSTTISDIITHMKLFEASTCLKFEESDESGDGSSILFDVTNDLNCYVNRTVVNGIITIYLNVDNFCDISSKVGSVLHLVMHALGFPHEHVRNDRDNHLIVIGDNIENGYEREFDKDPNDIKYYTDYDYDSVLHMDFFFRSKEPGIATMVGNKQNPLAIIGQRSHLSKLDIEKINKAFCPHLATPESVPRGPASVTATPATARIEPETVASTKANRGRTTVALTSTQAPPTPVIPMGTVEQGAQTIAPSRSAAKRCQNNDIVLINSQTMSRTTIDGDRSRRKFATKFRTVTERAIDYGSLLSSTILYPGFEGNLATIRTLTSNEQTLVLQTIYNEDRTEDGLRVFKEKLETRNWECLN